MDFNFNYHSNNKLNSHIKKMLILQKINKANLKRLDDEELHKLRTAYHVSQDFRDLVKMEMERRLPRREREE